MGACLFNSKTKDVLTAGTHGSTFGGNPIACAGGIAVIDRITGEGFLDEVNEKASYIKTMLEESSAVKSVSGKGMMIGITLADESKKAADAAKKALEKGLLVLTAKEKVRLLPPLNITYDELNDGMKILLDILEE